MWATRGEDCAARGDLSTCTNTSQNAPGEAVTNECHSLLNYDELLHIAQLALRQSLEPSLDYFHEDDELSSWMVPIVDKPWTEILFFLVLSFSINNFSGTLRFTAVVNPVLPLIPQCMVLHFMDPKHVCDDVTSASVVHELTRKASGVRI